MNQDRELSRRTWRCYRSGRLADPVGEEKPGSRVRTGLPLFAPMACKRGACLTLRYLRGARRPIGPTGHGKTCGARRQHTLLMRAEPGLMYRYQYLPGPPRLARHAWTPYWFTTMEYLPRALHAPHRAVSTAYPPMTGVRSGRNDPRADARQTKRL